jgi:uncharacterized surface protein with fasciclin (FAS1) repeats
MQRKQLHLIAYTLLLSTRRSSEVLCEIIDATSLGDDLDAGTWTVFAPVNEAFDMLPMGAVEMYCKLLHCST